MSQGCDSALKNKLNYGFAEVVLVYTISYSLYAEFAEIVSIKSHLEKYEKVSILIRVGYSGQFGIIFVPEE